MYQCAKLETLQIGEELTLLPQTNWMIAPARRSSRLVKISSLSKHFKKRDSKVQKTLNEKTEIINLSSKQWYSWLELLNSLSSICSKCLIPITTIIILKPTLVNTWEVSSCFRIWPTYFHYWWLATWSTTATITDKL